jgi:acyl carrier protein
VLLAVVAEKTGYPAEMLGLDMALDADLGIDSIKRVEILSALQEKLPNAPTVKPEHLGTLHTLRDIVSFLMPAPASAPPQETQRPFDSALTLASKEGERQSFSTADMVLPVELPRTAYVAPPKPVTLVEPPPMIPPSYAGFDSRAGIDTRTAVEEPSVAVTRSIVRPVLLDPNAPRSKVKLDKFAPVWLIAEPSSMTAKISQHLDAAGCRPQFIP